LTVSSGYFTAQAKCSSKHKMQLKEGSWRERN